MTLELLTGRPLPFGAHRTAAGINFSVFSRHATRVSLLLFTNPQDVTPTHVIKLDPICNRTGDVWHVSVNNIEGEVLYGWQADGPYEPSQGQRFNQHQFLLDPYATALVGTDCWSFANPCGLSDERSGIHAYVHDDVGTKAKCFLPDDYFDWQGDCPPNHAWSKTIIYETHIRGLTIHPSSAAQHPGTFLGVLDKIPYLKSLGVTAIEVLPVQEFYENELILHNPLNGECLRNYWGYSTVSFFAPKETYGTKTRIGCQIEEFKVMVRELHRADIEIILDVVFNHTAEGDEVGPTLNFRGLGNSIYYLLGDDLSKYKNYSGTGNTLNCNHPIVRDYILDCLRHWVIEMHVDGFRFDLASVLGRDENGNMQANPPLLERIAEDPILSRVKLIAEAWDAGGAYQLGSFPGMRWSEWNDRYRDDIRRFWRGDAGMTGALASRLSGSADVYQYSGKLPLNSINYISCHDGFTLNDLVSYSQKHNQVNGENNLDGSNSNYSDNNGIEGPTDDIQVEIKRLRQIKNMIATLILSRGVPMMLGGDEFRRSQAGNNNAYCQDNAVSWYDWRLLEQNQALFDFVVKVIALRKRFEVLCVQSFYKFEEVQWFGPDMADPDWDGPSGLLGCAIYTGLSKHHRICILFNATNAFVRFKLPELTPTQKWQILLNTAEDMVKEDQREMLLNTNYCSVMDCSLIVLNVAEQNE
jgi:isoamylase